MESILKISALMAIVCIANIAPVTTQTYSQGSFSSSSDDRISIYYSSSDSSSNSLSVNGYGTADKCTHSGKFILAGNSYNINGKTNSICIEGTLGLEDKSWTISGRNGNKSLTGTGKYKLDSSSGGSNIMGSFDVPKEGLTVTDSGYQVPAVCGELMSMSFYGSGNQEFSYSWSGTTQWDDDSTVSWSVSGTKSSSSESHSISGSISSMNYNSYSNSPSGCLTSLKVDNITDSFTGSGHINGRGLQVSGRLHSGMYIADMVSLMPAMDMPSFTGSFYYYQGSDGSFSSSSMTSSVSGSIFENGTFTTLLPGNYPTGDVVTGTYSSGMFQGTGKISYMDATVTGQYGASCWFTDSVMVTCPTIAPDTTNNYNFYNGSFYLCGTITPGAVNKTQLTASGWIFTAKNQSDPMQQLTAEAVTVTADIESSDMMSSYDESSVNLSITNSAGVQSSLSMKGYISNYNGQVSGMLSNDKVSLSLTNSKFLGNNLVVTGSGMNM